MKYRIDYLFILIALAGLSASCQNDEFSGSPLASDLEMSGVNVVSTGAATKCGGLKEEEELLGEVPIVTPSGDTVYLAAYISDTKFEEETPCTKGVQIHNKADLASDYGYFNMNVFDGAEVYQSIDEKKVSSAMDSVEVCYSGSAWNFPKTYYWPIDTTDLYFCSYTEGSGTGVKSFDWDNTTKTFSIGYATPAPESNEYDALNQYDLLVALSSQNKKTNEGKVNVNFRHALTSVRFIQGNITGLIETVSLSNFYSEGTLNVREDTLFWTGQASPKTFVQTFNHSSSTESKDKYLDSSSNLEKTFMLIPQNLDDNAELSIFIYNTLHPETVRFKDLGIDSKLSDWSSYAGKTITFRLSSTKINNISVVVTDSYSGNVKNNIKITNDGQKEIYIRAVLVGNWLNVNGHILASWDESNSYGHFTSAANFPTTLPSNWVKGSDGFYYYKKYIAPGAVVKQNLFDSFTVDGKPLDTDGTWGDAEVSEEDKVLMKITNLELIILVQAVKADANLTNAKSAWLAGCPELASILTNSQD